MELVDPIELTKDMMDEMFMTREGKVVQMTEWISDITYPGRFSDGNWRSIPGRYYSWDDPRDIIKHLPQSKYPEYYL